MKGIPQGWKIDGFPRGSLGFGDKLFLSESENKSYLELGVEPARWMRKPPPGQLCEICGLPGTKNNPITCAHRIGFLQGRQWFGMNADALDRKVNLLWAHRTVCNAKAELDFNGAIKFLKSKDGYGYTGKLPSFVDPNTRELWETGKESWPPLDVPKIQTVKNEGIFMTKDQYLTILKRTTDRNRRAKLKRGSPLGECACCGSIDKKTHQHEWSHRIGYAVGLIVLGLTPTFLDSQVNLVTACRTLNSTGKKCNKLMELNAADAMKYLYSSVGIKTLPKHLPKPVLNYWEEVIKKVK